MGYVELAGAAELIVKKGTIHTVYSEERTKLFNLIFRTLAKGYSVSNLLYANLILPNYLGTFITPDNFNSLSSTPSSENNTINEAILYMQKNFDKKITVEEIAKYTSTSSSLFFKKFKKSTRYSPVAYFNLLKIQKAIQLIHSLKYNISEVGSKVGIDDPYYFSRLFKKQMGISPRMYINEFIARNEIHD
jgi:AraC-like DNA-binding protein